MPIPILINTVPAFVQTCLLAIAGFVLTYDSLYTASTVPGLVQ